MFEKLYTKLSILSRHKKAPYKEERERYLKHCEQEGYSLSTLQNIARELLWVAKKLRISFENGVTLNQVELLPEDGQNGNDIGEKRLIRTVLAVALSMQQDRGYVFWAVGEKILPFRLVICLKISGHG